VARILCHSQSRSFDSGGRASWSDIVTRAVTLSLVWYRRVCNAGEWARCAPHPCTRSRTTWWNVTSKQLRSTYGRSLHNTIGIGTQDNPSSSWLTGHPLTTLLAWPHLLFWRVLPLPWDHLFGALPNRERPTISYALNLVDSIHDIHNYDHQHFKLTSDWMKTCYDYKWGLDLYLDILNSYKT
jgi:hypothetical protein